jgi:hypothetical protein
LSKKGHSAALRKRRPTKIRPIRVEGKTERTFSSAATTLDFGEKPGINPGLFSF